MKYSQVGSWSAGEGGSQRQPLADGASSVASSSTRHRRFSRRTLNSDLSEPLTAGGSIVDEELGSVGSDPYFVFRADLQKKLGTVDESLAEFLRVVHETVRS